MPGLGDKFYTDDDGADVNTSLSFEWKKNNEENKESEAVEITKQNGSEYIANAEGYYYGYAITERNLVTKRSDNASIYRVTNQLKKPTPTDYNISGLSYGSEGIVEETVIIEFKTRDIDGKISRVYKYDTIEYQWYKGEALEGSDSYKELEGARGFVTDGQITFTPPGTGVYRVKLLIKRNSETIPANLADENDTSNWYTLETAASNGSIKNLTITIQSKDYNQ